MALERTLFTRATLERALTVVVVCAIVWVGVEVAKGSVDVLGPTSGTIENAPLSAQMDVISGQVCVDSATLPGRVRSLWIDALPALYGTKRVSMGAFGINTPAWTGWPLLSWLLPAVAGLMLIRVAATSRADLLGPPFCVYLFAVGATAALAYPLACAVTPGFPAVIRYVLLALFVPVAIAAAYLKREPVRALKGLAVAGLVVWASLNAFDNVAAVRAFQTSAEPDHRRALADYLVTHGIRYSRADYWDAYITDFLTREQVVVASTGKVRVREYERALESHAQEAVAITREPCADGDIRVDTWCLRKPR
jgi:hypothetical protein